MNKYLFAGVDTQGQYFNFTIYAYDRVMAISNGIACLEADGKQMKVFQCTIIFGG